MTAITALWLPILLSAVFVFLASSVIHMASPWHKSDYPKMPQEDAVMDALRPLAIPPGDYMVPRPASREDMRSPAFAEKLAKGPVLIATVMPNGMMSMGRNFILWFLYCLAIGGASACIAGAAIPPGGESHRIFHFVAATAFLAHASALWPMSIWYRRSWMTTIKGTVDGLIYALVTAGTFVWLWPK
jgi:hypothetical protein